MKQNNPEKDTKTLPKTSKKKENKLNKYEVKKVENK